VPCFHHARKTTANRPVAKTDAWILGCEQLPFDRAVKIPAFAFICLVVLTGDSHAQVASSPPKGAPRVVFGDLRREDDSKFTKVEQRIIAAARHYVEEQDKAPLDAYYKFIPSSDGYDVYILHVSGYTGNKPFFTSGGFCEIHLDKSGKVLGLYPGA
jgi:hypothetical protein